MKISVIIPTYNSALTIERAISSVLSQSLKVDEILVCDDGSTDNTKQLVESLNCDTLRWIDCGRNFGPAVPRNIGIVNSTYEWIAFLDSDDYWYNNKLEEQKEYLMASGSLAVCCNAHSNSNFQEYLSVSSGKLGISKLLYENNIITSSVLIRKDLLFSTNLFPISKRLIVGEDYVLWLRVLNFTNWGYISTPLLYYHDSPSTSIRKYSHSAFQSKLVVLYSSFLFTKFKLYYSFYILKFITNYILRRV